MAFGTIRNQRFFRCRKTQSKSKGAEYPRFAKPQRVAFVQSAWHRDVVAECREAFLAEIDARHIARASIDVFEVPGAFENSTTCAAIGQDPALHRDRGGRACDR